MPSRATRAEHVDMAMYEVRVVGARHLTPHLRRITLAADTLRTFLDDGPDQRIKLLLPRAGQDRPVVPSGPEGWYPAWRALAADVRPVLRTYTVRHARPADGELDVDIVVHGDTGPGSAWATRTAPGDRVALFGAYAEYEAAPDAVQLLAGDHTALPALAAICEGLSRSARGHVVVEVAGAEEHLPLAVPAGVGVTWVHTAPGAPGAALAAAVRALGGGFDYAWVAADQETAATVRRHLVRERGLRPEQVMFMGYWRTDGAIDD